MRPRQLFLFLFLFLAGFPIFGGLAAFLAGGCGRAATSGPGASSGKTRLVYWVTSEVRDVAGLESRTREYGDYEKIQAAEYMKTHPDLQIEVQPLSGDELTKKVTTAIAAGTPPDLLKDYLGRTSGYAYQGLLADFRPVLPRSELEDYDPFYLKLYTINGQLHGLPTYVWAVHVVANRAIWEAVGKADLLPPEGEGSWTYAQFLTAMRAVARPGKLWPWWAQFSSEQGDYCNYGFFWGKGAFMYRPGDYRRVAINTPKGVEALSLLVQMAREGLIPPGCTTMAGSELENMVGKGQTAAWGDSLYVFHRMQIAQREGRVSVPLKLQVLQFPHEDGLKAPLPVGPTGLVVFKQQDARKQAAAMEFARWLNTPEFQRICCANVYEFPTRKSTGNPMADNPNYKLVRKWMEENGKVDLGLTSPAYYKTRVAAIPHLQAAMLEQKSPAEALRDFEVEAEGILSERR